MGDDYGDVDASMGTSLRPGSARMIASDRTVIESIPLIPSELGTMDELICQIENDMEKLEARIRPVLAPCSPEVSGEPKRDGSDIPLVDNLQNKNNRLRSVMRHIQSLTRRVEA